MILHQQLPHPEATLDPWLALHCESLTLALCEPRGSVIHISPIGPLGPISPISNTSATPDAFPLVAANIRRHLPHFTTRISPSPLPTSHPALGTLPDYLLLNSLSGTTPAILHTQDPVALYLAQDARGTLGNAEYFRSSTDLSVEGWAYWWEDAQRAFHKLTVQFLQATGHPVPPALAAAIRHD